MVICTQTTTDTHTQTNSWQFLYKQIVGNSHLNKQLAIYTQIKSGQPKYMYKQIDEHSNINSWQNFYTQQLVTQTQTVCDS